MSRARRVARNSIILGLQQVFINLLSLFVIGYVARKLGKVDYGLFSLAFTFTVFFSFVGHLGLRTLTIREVAKKREQSGEYLGKIIPARLFLITLMTIIIPLAAFILNYDKKTIVIITIASLSAMLDQLSRIISDVFQAYEEMGKVAFRDIAVKLITGGVSVAALFYGYKLIAVSWIYVAGTLSGLVINVIMFNGRFVWPKLEIDYGFIWKNIKNGLSFMLLGMATTLYSNVNILILSKMLDIQAVGVYSASANLFCRLGFIADAVATSSFPAIAQLYLVKKEEANSVLSKSLCTIITISVPISVGGIILSDEIISMVYGSAYASSSVVFSIMMASLPLLFLSLQLNYALSAINLQFLVLKIFALLIILNLASNLLIIPIYGIKGAAITTLCTEAIGFILYISCSVKYFSLVDVLRSFKVLIIPVAVMILTLSLVSGHGLIISVISGALSYVIALYLIDRKQVLAFVTFFKK